MKYADTLYIQGYELRGIPAKRRYSNGNFGTEALHMESSRLSITKKPDQKVVLKLGNTEALFDAWAIYRAVEKCL